MRETRTQLRSFLDLKPAVELPEALPDRIYGALKYRILTCALAPGQRLNELEIAAELKVSRTPLREALNRLSQESLLVRIPYSGYTVTPVTADDIQNLCEVRLILETETAGFAAERATVHEIDRLMQCAELRYKPGNRETYLEYLRANSVFHRELARASHNARLESMVMAVLDELQRPLYLGLDVGLDAPSATEEHVVLAETIKKRKPAEARRLHRKQITEAGLRMVAGIGNTAPKT